MKIAYRQIKLVDKIFKSWVIDILSIVCYLIQKYWPKVLKKYYMQTGTIYLFIQIYSWCKLEFHCFRKWGLNRFRMEWTNTFNPRKTVISKRMNEREIIELILSREYYSYIYLWF